MSAVKIMPCLDMKDGRVVKGVHFVELKEAGDPVDTAAVKELELIAEASARFVPGKVVVAIDARRNRTMASGFELLVAGGTKPVGQDAVARAKICEGQGAVSFPVVASGGAGTLEHFFDGAVKEHLKSRGLDVEL